MQVNDDFATHVGTAIGKIEAMLTELRIAARNELRRMNASGRDVAYAQGVLKRCIEAGKVLKG